MKQIIDLLPLSLREQFENLPNNLLEKIEEIRIRISRPIELKVIEK